MNLTVHSLTSAPKQAQGDLQAVADRYGFVPNLMGVMAGAPSLLKAYLQTGELFSRTSLTPVEQQVVLLTVSESNRCDYCMAAHSVAARMQKVPEEVIRALRDGVPLADARLEALRALTADIVERRGWPAEQSVAAFLTAGYAHEQFLEVILGVGMKTLSNYTNHAAHTPLDKQFAAAAWSTPVPHDSGCDQGAK
jgi:AhpD family alkylhydroperoxidase